MARFGSLVQAESVAEEAFTAKRVVAEDFAALVHQLARVIANLLIPDVCRVIRLVEKSR